MSKLDRRSFIKKTSLSGAALASSTLFTGSSQKKNFTKSPFSNLDILATNDWWNRSDNEIINLKGAIEIAPILGLSDYIVDLVQTGNTLKDNGLSELEVIQDISTRLIINKSSFKTNNQKIEKLIISMKNALNENFKN